MSRSVCEISQITVKEASRRLQLTERTVLNFIKLRRVDAVKVGKEWFIDYPSFISFCQRYQFNVDAVLVDEKVNKESVITNPKNKTSSKEVKMGLASLRVFQYCAELFETEKFKKTPNQDFEKRLRELSFKILENLGAGYHSFGTSIKLNHYSQSRGSMGAILALLFQNSERKSEWCKEIEEIEVRILPAFSALLRKIEKRPSMLRPIGDT